jgi:MFS superfamily sulfate permease-like transporter
VHAVLERSQGAPTWFCIDAAAIGDVDYSAGETILSVHAQMQEHGTRLVFADVDDDVKAELDRFGITALVGEDGFFSSIVEVVEAFRAAAPERTGDQG